MSNMVVNTNVLALNSHRAMKQVGNAQATASARLSSGLKINSAADDAAGLSISEKMRAQIRGLDMASKNAQDAISLIQTAEGGMQEIDNMLQRIRELTVNASNDTNDFDSKDRVKMQDEITQLVKEIDSMADRVEFNKKKVIDGSFRDSSVQNLVDIRTLVTVPDSTPTPGVPGAPATIAPKDKAVVDMAAIKASADYAALAASQDSAAKAYMLALDAVLNKTAGTIQFADFTLSLMDITETGGAAKAIEDGSVTADKAALANIIAALTPIAASLDTAAVMPSATQKVDGTALTGNAANVGTGIQAIAAAIDAAKGSASDATSLAAVVTALETFIGANTQTNWTDLLAAAKASDTFAGNTLAGVEAYLGSNAGKDAISQVLADVAAAKKIVADGPPSTGGGAGTPASASTLYFQVGANTNQKLELNINSVKSDALGIGDGNGTTYIDVNKYSGSEITELIKGLDDALSYVTTERSKLGAAQNRLEYTMKSLDISSENLSASESRIRDTDMAKEMMNLTRANVLQQAATSMLAQANQAPQSVLQLLR